MDNFVNSQDIEGNTAILLSIKNVFKYSNELFEYLEQNIDKINFQDSNGISCLMIFSIYNFSAEFIKYLIKNNAKTILEDKFNRNAFSYASIPSNKKFLLEYFENYQ